MWQTQASLMFTACFLSLILYVASLSKPTIVQESHCEPHLRQASSDPYGYRLRGDRCEGIYIKDVASTTLLVASLTESVEDLNPASGQSLLVEWTALGSESIRLRAYSLIHRLYYQMDSLRPAGRTSYIWPMDLLAALNFRKNDLGIVAWTSYQVGNTKREVYLPLRIRRQAAAGKSRGYQLVLLPGIELTEVFISLAPVKKDESLGAFFIKDKALGYGYYPAERGVTITIPELKMPGIYYLEIGATLRAGGSSSAKVWFYHNDN